MDTEEQVELIKQSSLFDEQWYLAQYPDVARLKMCPVTHFVRYGWRVGRNPSPHFNTRHYLKRYADVSRTGENPLVHFLRHGRAEGRTSVPMTATSGFRARPTNPLPNDPITPAEPPLPATVQPRDDAHRIELQLEQTQQLLEHYFKRCQELEYRLI